MRFGSYQIPGIGYKILKDSMTCLQSIIGNTVPLKKLTNNGNGSTKLAVSLLESTINKLSKEGYTRYINGIIKFVTKLQCIPSPELLLDITHIVGIHGNPFELRDILLFVWTNRLLKSFEFVIDLCKYGIPFIEHMIVGVFWNKCSISGKKASSCTCFGLNRYHSDLVQSKKKMKSDNSELEFTQTALLVNIYKGIKIDKISGIDGICMLYYFGDLQNMLPKVWILMMSLLMDGTNYNSPTSDLGNITHLNRVFCHEYRNDVITTKGHGNTDDAQGNTDDAKGNTDDAQGTEQKYQETDYGNNNNNKLYK